MLIGLRKSVWFTACWKWCGMGALGMHGPLHVLVAGAASIGFVLDLPHAWLGAPGSAWVEQFGWAYAVFQFKSSGCSVWQGLR